jgi:hypothetical protein
VVIASLLAWVFWLSDAHTNPNRRPFLFTGDSLASGSLPQREMTVLRLSDDLALTADVSFATYVCLGFGVILGDEFRYALAPRS